MAKDVRFDIRAENKTKTAFNSVKKDLGSITSGIKSMNAALVGVAAATAGIYALAKGISVVTEAAMTQRNAEAKLNAVIQATGGAAGRSLSEMKAFAAGLQEVTAYGDEVVLSGMSILATFKNVRTEVFDRTTKAALDMSTVMGQDLKSSMIQLGKALNDPTVGLSSLSRVGITFTESQKEMIKTLQESGDLLGAQGIILEELESQFGGAAENIDPFTLALAQLKNTFGDILEEIGFAIVDNETFVQLMQELQVYLKDLIPIIGDVVAEFIEWVGPVDEVIEKLDNFIEITKQTISVLSTLAKYASLPTKILSQGAAAVYTGGEALVTGDFSKLGGFGPSAEESREKLNAIRAERGGSLTGGGGGSGTTQINYNTTIQPTFMSGDANAARVVASEINTAVKDMNKRQGNQ